jgi:hypothetical protein
VSACRSTARTSGTCEWSLICVRISQLAAAEASRLCQRSGKAYRKTRKSKQTASTTESTALPSGIGETASQLSSR